jgi:hypothetical protein
MAENESLNPADPKGQKWNAVRRAIAKGEPLEKVVRLARKALYRGLRNTQKQCVEYGINFQMLLENRNSPQVLRQFVKATLGHDYVQLFRDVAVSSAQCDTEALLRAYVGAIWETVADRIVFKTVTSKGEKSLNEMRNHVGQVAEQLQTDFDRIARKLADDPSGKLRMPSDKNGQPTEATVDMLRMSLLKD